MREEKLDWLQSKTYLVYICCHQIKQISMISKVACVYVSACMHVLCMKG